MDDETYLEGLSVLSYLEVVVMLLESSWSSFPLNCITCILVLPVVSTSFTKAAWLDSFTKVASCASRLVGLNSEETSDGCVVSILCDGDADVTNASDVGSEAGMMPVEYSGPEFVSNVALKVGVE